MSRKGFTLVEMLLSIAILGVLMLAFTQVFGGSLRASSEVNARNELVSEGQVAQQLITSRLQNAFHIYSGVGTDPNPMTLAAQNSLSRNTIRGGVNWVPNADPFVAMLLPPTRLGTCPAAGVAGNVDTSPCFTFYAYYAMRRDIFVGLVPRSAPDPDPNNANVWVLLEYSAMVRDGVTRNSLLTNCPAGNAQGGLTACPPVPGTPFGAAYTGQVARMLVDYVQPTTQAPAYTMFRICTPNVSAAQSVCPAGTTATSPRSVEFDLRLLQNRVGKALTAPTGNGALSSRIYSRNY